MKEGRTPVAFEQFTKVNEDVDAQLLQPNELPQLENAVLDNPYGKIHVRGGMDSKNDTGLSGNDLYKLINVRDKDGDEYLLGGTLTTIARSTTSNWTNVRTGLTGTGRFESAPIRNGIAMTNGVDKPFVLFDTAFGSNENLELERPDVTLQEGQRCDETVNGGAGELDLSSRYAWIWVYVTETGERSAPSNPFTFGQDGGVSTGANAGQQQFLFSNVPVPTDTRIVSKWLFRTEGDLNGARTQEAKFFYLVAKFDASETQVIDGKADDDLDFAETIVFVRTPLKANYIVKSNGRLFLGGITLQQRNYRDHYQRVRTVAGGTTTIGSGGDARDYLNSSVDGHPVTPTTAGAMDANSYYMWAVTFVDKNGFESTPMYTNIMPTDATKLQGTLTQLNDAYIGANDDIDIEIVKRRYYRTVGVPLASGAFTWEDKPFYFASEEDYAPADEINRNLPHTYVEGKADASLDANKYWYQNKLTRDDTPAQPVEFDSGVSFSQIGQEAYFRLENVKPVFEEDGDSITGMFDDGNGVLIFKENSIVKLYHTGAPDHWYIRKIWEQHGCDEPKSLVKSGSTYYFRYRGRAYAMTSGQAPQYIGLGKQNTLDGMTILDGAVNDEWVHYLTTDSTDYYILVFDKNLQTWYQFNFGTNEITCICMKRYDDFWTIGNLLAVASETVYQYVPDDPTDDILLDEVQPKITFPNLKINETTYSKIRQVVFSLLRTGTVNVNIYSDDAGYTPTAITSGNNIIRYQLPNYGISSYWKIQIDGDFTHVDGIRGELRPIMRGSG